MDKIRILIADGTPSVRQFIRYSLEDYFPNISIEMASNGKNIRKRLEGTPFNLILCDSELPLLSGWELLKWLRNQEKLKNVSFIMISSERDEKSLRKAVELGADAYLVKPLLMDDLVSKVKEVTSKFDNDKFDRRKHERFKTHGTVLFTFNSHSCSGRLINISMGGLLGAVDKDAELPRILEKVQVSLELDNKKSIHGIEAEVVRIQVVDSFSGSKKIQYGVEFTKEFGPEKKRVLIDLISSISRVQKAYSFI